MTSTDAAPPGWGELTAREKDALLIQAVVVLGTVPDLTVALVRTVRRQRGVQLGPMLVTVALAVLTPRLARVALRTPGRRGAAARVALAVAAPVLPAAGAAVRATVVGRRHPLWQLAVSAAVRVVGGCLTALPVALAVARRRREGLSAA